MSKKIDSQSIYSLPYIGNKKLKLSKKMWKISYIKKNAFIYRLFDCFKMKDREFTADMVDINFWNVLLLFFFNK